MIDYKIMLKYLPIIILVLSNIATYVFMKRRRDAKDEQEENLAKKGELDNIQEALSMYREMMGDLREQLSRASETYFKLEIEFDKIVTKEKECRELVKVLRAENLTFYRKINTCEFDCELSKKNNHG